MLKEGLKVYLSSFHTWVRLAFKYLLFAAIILQSHKEIRPVGLETKKNYHPSSWSKRFTEIT